MLLTKEEKNTRQILLLLVVLGLFLRVTNVYSGLDNFASIDEGRVNATILRLGLSDLNPRIFIYPGLLYYILLPLYSLIKFFVLPVTDLSIPGVFLSYLVTGRIFIAILGSFNIILIYLIAKEVFGRYTALIAALLLAVDPMYVAWSFTLKPDMLMCALILSAFLFICKLYNAAEKRPYYILAGVFIGLAAAAKYNGIFIIGPFLIAHYWSAKNDFFNKDLFLALIFVFLGFFAFNPFVFFDFPNFLKNIRSEFNGQLEGYYFYPLSNKRGWVQYPIILFNLLGLGISVASACGILLSLKRSFKKSILIISFILFYLFVMGAFRNSRAAYLLPVIPFCLLFAAEFLNSFNYFGGKIIPARIRSWFFILPVIVFLSFGLYNCAYYLVWVNQEDPRGPAKSWMRKNIPAKSKLLMDGLGDDCPFGFLALRKLPYDIELIKWQKLKENSSLGQRRFDFIIINDTYEKPSAVKSFYEQIAKNYQLVKQFKPLLGRPEPSFMYSPLFNPTINIYAARGENDKI